MDVGPTTDIIWLYQVITRAGAPHLAPPRPPQRALGDAQGTVPVRAARFCEPLRAATGFGYHLFPPLDIHLLFDGADVSWGYDREGAGVTTLWPLLDHAYYPGFREQWERQAPPDLWDRMPALLLPGDGGPGHVQVWTGCLVETRPGWSTWVRGPVNDSRRSLGLEVLEGIIETDRWLGHLYVNVRLVRTDVEVLLSRDRPLTQLVPIRREDYSEATLRQHLIYRGLGSERARVWDRYARSTEPHELGRYAREARRRRADEEKESP
jgi:hypothetical protein